MSPLFLYRIGHTLYNRGVPFLPRIITYLNRFIFSAYVPCEVIIGKDVILGYGGLGVVLHSKVIIGDRCHISQNVTIGGTSKKNVVPKLGSDVYLGAGAKILGPVTIGDNVVVGANAVVITDIPSNTLVVGVPARIVKQGVLKSDYV